MRPAILSRINLPGLAVAAACIAVWELYSRTLGSHFDSIASSTAIFAAIEELLLGGPLLGQLWHTLSVALAGWMMASALGFTIGLLIGLSETAWTYTMASIDVLRSIPSICFVPIAVMWFGFSFTTEMVIVVYVSLWPLLLATMNSVHSAPAGLLDIARVFRLSKASSLFKIILPAALPGILVSLRLSLTLAIALAVVAEMIGNPEGLGFGMVFAQQAMQPAQAFGYLFVIGTLGWGVNAIFIMVGRRLTRGYERVL
jgi:ABC-type nitrate/sulfonate/bicarbonate transport system permease component